MSIVLRLVFLLMLHHLWMDKPRFNTKLIWKLFESINTDVTKRCTQINLNHDKDANHTDIAAK